MSEKEVLLSADGLKKMEEDLEFLKTVRRKEVANRIKQAIEFGDISENSEYEDAKNEQAFIEGSILDLEQKLRNARIIDTNDVNIDIVSVGSIVKVYDFTRKKEAEYTIVGSVEANPIERKISNESPVGAALIGKAVGSHLTIDVPAGVVEMEILEIRK